VEPVVEWSGGERHQRVVPARWIEVEEAWSKKVVNSGEVKKL
jgi:hypothetical protein